MSFGYSVGDFLAGASLTYQLVRALSTSRGASIEYQEALTELRAMEQAFIQTGNLVRSNMFTRDVINAIACIALSSRDTIEKFLERTRDLQNRVGHGKNGLDNSWSKIGWQLYGKEELRAIKTQLHERLNSINTLITTASNCIDIPSAVAQYQDRSIGNPQTHDINKQSTTSSCPPEYSQRDRPPSSSFGIEASGNSEQMPSHTPDLIQVVETDAPGIDESMASKKSVSTFLHSKPSVKKFAPTEGAAPRKREPDEVTPKIEISQAELEREIRTKIEIENAEAAAAAEAALANAQFQSSIEMIKQMMTSLHEKEARREAEAKATAEKAKEVKAPIRFKDAVGRKFSFPFHECEKWQGMEDLIKQAFLHVDVIGPHVQAGHYDLIGPNGEIILPQIWAKVIEPGWQITMHMWPMDRPGPPPPRPIAPNATQTRPPNHPRPMPPLPPHITSVTKHRPQHHRSGDVEGYRPSKPTVDYPINDPRSSNVPTHGQKGVLSWMVGARDHQRGQGTRSVDEDESREALNPHQLHDKSRSGSQDARGGLKKASEFGLLDRFNPNWREAYKSMISSRGLTDEFIRTHQVQIVRVLQSERDSITAQLPKGASPSLGECSTMSSSGDEESDTRKRRRQAIHRGSLKSSTRFKIKRHTIFKKKDQERDWKTDDE